MAKVVVIIPTYNEAENIGRLIEVLQKVFKEKVPDKWDMHMLVVDDTSPDGTADVVKKYMQKYKNVHLFLNSEKVGLGGAYMKGMRYAIDELKADLIFQMDADFQHDENLIPEFLEKVDQGADLVVGSRYMKGGSIPKFWGITRKFMSIGGNFYIRTLMLDRNIHDWTTGFRAVKPWVYEKVKDKITELKTYSFQISFLYFAKKAGAKIAEVPLNFRERYKGKSKMPGVEGMIKTFWFITKMRLIDFFHSRFFKFGIVGFTGFIVNYVGLELLRRMAFTGNIAASFETVSLLPILHEPTFWATLIATELAIISNFILNNVWTFKDKIITKVSDVIVQFLKFNLSSFFAVIVQPLIVGGAAILFSDTSLVRLIALLFALFFVIVPYNYIVYNLFIWKTWKLPWAKK